VHLVVKKLTSLSFLKIEAKFIAFDVWEQPEKTGGD
jgi:hypothetical protein